MKRNTILIICVVLIFAFLVGCGGGGSAADKIIGTWGVDIDSILATPEIKTQLESMPEMEDMMKMLSNTDLSIQENYKDLLRN